MFSEIPSLYYNTDFRKRLPPKIWRQSFTKVCIKDDVEDVKDALSGLRQFLATKSPLRMMENAFYFT